VKPVPIFYSVGEGRQARRRGWVAGDGWQGMGGKPVPIFGLASGGVDGHKGR